ncbi:hypothetical protein Q4Q35_02135 [Flavivirga aquimarina]|uniref:Uncharacterized protein n=1 Tax=Flavivirga aquimarina TaxID=2027862 RepID=A0ABT8W672_9FLAO|nr:hypothetical protein [Flavivirga aquimarina]MDO5968595.1 hypothetical protein [Flavivirga aquimarina]
MTTNLSSQECEYEEYYQIVDLARKEYSKQNYKEASKNFKLAFTKINFPLGIDLALSLFSANKIKDDLWAGVIAEKLAKGGIPLRYFFKYKKKSWYQKFNSEFEKYNEYYYQNFDTELKVKYFSLIERDAIFTRKTMDWYYGTIEIKAVDAIKEAKAIISELKQLTEKYGFPSEHNMGYNYTRRLNRVGNYTHIHALMIHIYKYGERVYENEIPNFICNGVLRPNFQQTLKQSMGFGHNMGIEHEMKVREKMYNKKKNK